MPRAVPSSRVGWLRRTTVAQRVVLSIGLAVALSVTAVWWISADYMTTGGWFAYAPDTPISTDTYFVVREREAAHLAIALGLDLVWTVTSVVLFGLRDVRSAEPHSP